MKKYSTPAYVDNEFGVTEFGSVDVYLASEVDARIAELEEFIKVLLPSWPDGEHYPTEMSLLRMKQERIAELEKAAKAVCDYDWSDNDDDAVRAIEKLRRVL